ncbi:alpha/beta hydrolase [Streptomyces sp. RY43-2]|uniref:Alpha/beta hydrolase n=1 Tax=Streptomyces macrolidinus TaxID=2952607 RepID=A0ABT0ZBK5_9ACTN|nr:alpha/beta hydrolase [Streptomyces macrolidinus]MCN9240554.1 alpha/beta hydrolase [Streptomyces macrolidinus]
MSAVRRSRSLRKPCAGLTALLTTITLAVAVPALATPADAAPRRATCGDPPVTLEPAAQAFLDKLATAGGPPIQDMTPSAARRSLLDLQAAYPVSKLPADITTRTVPGGSRTGPVSIRIVRPHGMTGRLPAVMYFHGGGWVLGDASTHDRLVRQIANGARAAVVFVDYARSPEARYPVANEQAYAATQWVARHGREINVDGSRLAVAGDSVGGNMTAAVTMMAKQRGGPRIAQQVLFYPVTDASFDTPSYRRFATNCWLTAAGMKWFWNHYAPDTSVRSRPTASPLRASTAQLRGLPRALVITDSDVLSDEGRQYATMLRRAGVPVTHTHYPRVVHDFVMLNALADTQAARSAVAQATTALRRSLRS